MEYHNNEALQKDLNSCLSLLDITFCRFINITKSAAKFVTSLKRIFFCSVYVTNSIQQSTSWKISIRPPGQKKKN